MNITLKVYNGREVVKEYTAETIDFSFGVIEDILGTIDVDNLDISDNKAIGFIVIKCMKQLKPLLKDIFVGITDEEIRNMGFEEVPVNVDYDNGDSVRVMNGPFENFVGVVQEINKEKHKVKVLVSMFGRETPVELEFSQVQKVN